MLKQIITEMREDTWQRLKSKFETGDFSSNKFTFTSMNTMDTSLQKKAFNFIKKLLNFGVKLDQVMTNDWESSPSIIVYVDGKEFRRFSDFDLRRALRTAGIQEKKIEALNKTETINPQAPTDQIGLNAPKYAQGTVVREFKKLAGVKTEIKGEFGGILKTTLTGKYQGYVLQGISALHGEPLGWKDMRRISKYSPKISYFFDTSKIMDVRRFDLPDAKHNLFIQAKDGKFYEAEY